MRRIIAALVIVSAIVLMTFGLQSCIVPPPWGPPGPHGGPGGPGGPHGGPGGPHGGPGGPPMPPHR